MLQYGDHVKELYGGEPDTTNNRMELTATIEALQALKKDCKVDLFTDSTYVKNGIQQWMKKWKLNSWKTAARKPVKNRDLWEVLDQQAISHSVNWHWVKGHAGDPGNEKADELANRGIDELQK